MSSPPSPTGPQNGLQPPPRRGHRHRRSAAISGDFDVQEFGLLPPMMSKSVPGPASCSLAASSCGSPVKSPLVQLAAEDSTLSGRQKILLTSTPASTHEDARTRYFITEDTKFESGSSVPRAMIDLDDVFMGSRAPARKSSRTMSAPELESFHIPKHSLLCSPKKNDVAIAEEITEEDFEDPEQLLTKISTQNSELSSAHSGKGTPLPAGVLLNDNCSSNSLNSLSSSNSLHKNLANTNTPSVSSLRGKVRYQSYYNSQQKINTQAASTPSSAATADSDRFGRKPCLMAPSSSSSPSSAFRGVSKSRSPIRNLRYQTPPQKNPFQFEPIAYEIPKSFHRDHGYTASMSNPSAAKLDEPVAEPKMEAHKRSNSLFSTLSSKFHHRRKSSLLSTRSSSHKASIIEKTTDEVFGLHEYAHANDSTLLFDDQTLTEDVIGEPGPMIEVVEPKPKPALARLSKNGPLKKHSKSRSTSFINFSSYDSKRSGATGASRFFSWMIKSNRGERAADN
ncbi:hypothetical protein KL921_000226 [Ogataea angusta]|uniref:Uncharacterized protein n=1 Tax=Pichia angusta TaxID=870730 RepID=A0AAN6DLM1_PICAN|nr:uncharacterized protein KL928_000567 [Ogataea angusta]KAG7813952.1 hypothetical protein KL921_000226 [Ogataea angusta]KAG7822092.1 hypothetical protein KL928_000567 [Ogataea angusta]KAG7825633.1 hypothetical protein KL909_000865 [Ogataea angusta]KAG7831440.1 hypothetical protein KL920_000960 [Ogataea angusta]KAG7837382.1 hypothetical protein KL943_001421 [Ogataea angusta]